MPEQALHKLTADHYWLWAMSMATLVFMLLRCVPSPPEALHEASAITSINEASAITSVRRIVAAEGIYSDTVGEGFYATLTELKDTGLVDSVLASGKKNGYSFVVTRGTRNSSYSITARPLAYGSTGIRSFYARGAIRVINYTLEDRPAAATDRLLGQ